MNRAIQTAAAVTLVMGGGYIGYIGASRYKLRVLQLKQLCDMLIQLKFNMSFLRLPVHEALKAAAISRRSTIGEVMRRMSEEMSVKGSSPGEAWRFAAKLKRKSLCITEEDLEILNLFAENLGRGDTESECRNIDAAFAKLTLAYNAASAECERKYKLVRGVGTLGGILAVILLM